MPERATGATLLAEILPGRASGADAALDGWAPPEVTHRWTVGAESHCDLPAGYLGPDCVFVVDVMPFIDDLCLVQTVMVAVDGRLIGTIQLSDQRALGFRLPATIDRRGPHRLSFTHLSSGQPRTPRGFDRNKLPLGLMVMSVRLYRLAEPWGTTQVFEALPGTIAHGDLPAAATRITGVPVPELVSRFESLGHDCEVGTVQRAFGAEPLGLLRFAGAVTHRLAEGLLTGFAGVGDSKKTTVLIESAPDPEFRVNDELYYLWYWTRRYPSETTREAVHKEQCRRLRFLQRKFLEDLELGEKIFTTTRTEPMTEAEALPLFCALNVHARNTLLWTLPGDPALAGSVQRLMPGYLLGHLGSVDPVHHYATHEAWLSVMVNAIRMQRRLRDNPATAS